MLVNLHFVHVNPEHHSRIRIAKDDYDYKCRLCILRSNHLTPLSSVVPLLKFLLGSGGRVLVLLLKRFKDIPAGSDRYIQTWNYCNNQRRRIYTEDWEEKAKVVNALRGTELIPFPAALAVLWRKGWIVSGWNEEKDECNLFFQIVLVQNSYHGKEFNQFCPPNSSDNLCLIFCRIPSSMVPIEHM